MKEIAKQAAVNAIMQMQKDGILSPEGVALVIDQMLYLIDIEKVKDQEKKISSTCNEKLL